MQPFNQKMSLNRGIHMQENVELNELEKSLNNIKQLTDRMTKNLERVNTIITENINTGDGIWDSEQASLYRTKWETVMKDFPTIIKTVQQQESNLANFIENMKKVEEQ